MCGILGVISKNKIKASVLKKMNKEIEHRGPDDEGYLFINEYEDDITLNKRVLKNTSNDYLGFAHRRLSIVDLSDHGHQPMSYNDRYWIVYNGEIYNYIEIKDELQKDGYIFNSTTDTEMILAAYDKWGHQCQNKFNGMWAFVIYDSLEDIVFISRDRFGIKPLYYYVDDEKFIFASEIKSILAYPELNIRPNSDYLKNYIVNGPAEYIKETAFENIFRFEQTSYIECKTKDMYREFKEIKYWDFNVNLSNEKFCEEKAKELAEQYYELLKDSVRLRLRADVKVGSALSGGLDSSSIVYLINQILKENKKEDLQETFSTVYKTAGTTDCDESVFIDLLAKELNVNTNQIEPKQDDIPEAHSKMIYIMDTPPESTVMSGWYTFKKVAETDVTVTLDGQGADEQLGGYLMYLLPYFSSLSLSNIFSEYKSFLKIPGAKRMALQGIIINIFSRFFGKKLTKKIINKLFKREFIFHLNEQLLKDTMSTLGTLIHYSDRNSMKYSIESRMPFMDYRLVEFLASVPAVYKIHNGWTKYLARVAFDEKLPDEVTWRKDKMGWPIPEEYWFRGGLKDWFIKQILSSDFIRELDKTFDINKEIESKKNIAILIRYLNIAVWHKRFFL